MTNPIEHIVIIVKESRTFDNRADSIDLNRFRRFFKWTLRGQAALVEG